MHPAHGQTRRTDMQTPTRNRYFYGKLLDVHHFELETNYFNAKRWLLNRLVSGYGVVCGLGVQWARERPDHVVVTPGFAIDKWGREIVVPQRSAPIPIRPAAGPAPEHNPEEHGEGDARWAHVVLCYHECEADPVPSLGDECEGVQCAPGSIRERYCLDVRDGCAPPIATDCRIPDLMNDGQIEYRKLAEWVTDGCCGAVADDPCIPLANVRLPRRDEAHPCPPDDIDISVRPIVYSNDLLFDLLLCLLTDAPRYRGGKS